MLRICSGFDLIMIHPTLFAAPMVVEKLRMNEYRRWRRESQEFVDAGLHERRILAEGFQIGRVLKKRSHSRSNQICGGLIANHHQ